MAGIPALFVLVPNHKRKIDHPAKRQEGWIAQTQAVAEEFAQAPEALEDDSRLVGDKEQQITLLCLQALDDFLDALRGQEIGKRGALAPVGGEGKVSKPLGAEFLDELSQLIELFAAVIARPLAFRPRTCPPAATTPSKTW